MPNHRHHIHLICDSKDASLYPLLDALAIYFERHAHITKDLFLVGSDSANYSWRCIHDCDCAFMLIGKSYGELNNTGVSQLHISYLNARTKNKPLIVFVIDNDDDRPRQLADLIQVVKEQVSPIFYVDDNTQYNQLLTEVYDMLDGSFMGETSTPATLTSKISPDLPSSLARFEPTSNTVHKPLPSLQDEVLLNCTAHAFRGGTLIEAGFMATTTWRAILSSLDKSLAFNNQGLWRLLNTLITAQALPAVQTSDPSVHAISRCQVIKADIVWVQEELLSLGWIVPNPVPTAGKPTWRISETAKKALGI